VVETPFPANSLGFFPGNIGAVSDEHGVRFQQDISRMEKKYIGKWNTNLLVDYCWTLVRETPTEEYKRQKMIKLVSHCMHIYIYYVVNR
jgi:hypothetical protein